MSKLYAPKELKCGFIILCSEHNPDLLDYTARSIRNRYGEVLIVAVSDENTKDVEMKAMKAVCPSFKGQKTFTSLINTGYQHAADGWNFLVMAGTTMRNNLELKMSYFVESEKDVLFPIANNKHDFVDGTLNGLLIHKNTFREVGNMLEDEELEFSKAEWAMRAVGFGCKFKAIIGAKLC